MSLQLEQTQIATLTLPASTVCSSDLNRLFQSFLHCILAWHPVLLRDKLKHLCECAGHFTSQRVAYPVLLWDKLKRLCECAGHFRSQRVATVEQALIGSTMDVDALVTALQALHKSLSPSPTPGELFPIETILLFII